MKIAAVSASALPASASASAPAATEQYSSPARGPRENRGLFRFCSSARSNQLNNEQTSAIRSVLEDAMTNAAQALLLTAGLFGLSFFMIFAMWYAERLRYGTAGKLPL
jgi:hypothetical protein